VSRSLPSDSAADPNMRRFREYVGAAIALMVVVGMVALVVAAFSNLGSSDQAWERIKELLLLVNPLVGVVIGYYFNKVSTEARAESAEATAKSASAAAQQAEIAREGAQAEAIRAQSEAHEARDSLSELAQTADRHLRSGADDAGVLGGDPEARNTSREDLLAALARARRILQ